MKPILFNTEMVKAILDDRKVITRRVVKPRHRNNYFISEAPNGKPAEFKVIGFEESMFIKLAKPQYQIGDIMYVRETWCKWINGNVYYKAAPIPQDKGIRREVKWRPSIHMPKEAARLFLKVTDVGAVRLQDMSHDAPIQEGIKAYTKDGDLYKYAISDDWWMEFYRKHKKEFDGTFWQEMPENPVKAFSYLWDSTITKDDIKRYGWKANPWVWVIEFEKVDRPTN